MDWDILFSFLGYAAGCIAGIVSSQRLTGYRLQQLEAKVNKHNSLVERMTASEIRIQNIEERIRESI